MGQSDFGLERDLRDKMKLLKLFLLICSVVFAFGFVQAQKVEAQTNPPKIYKFANENWFDGKRFRRQIFYLVKGILTYRRPSNCNRNFCLRHFKILRSTICF